MGRLDGQVAFITGAGAGIGRAAARLFAGEGATIVIAEIDKAAGTATQDVVNGVGGRALAVETDITDEASVRDAVAAGVAAFGPPTILFNCAGGSLPEDSSVVDADMAVWDRTMTLDLKGTILCCRHVIPHMVDAGEGAVVNMSSGAALRGSSPAHIYTAAKGAILSLTRALAGQYARNGIRANAICSGRILTERIVSAYGRPGEKGPIVDRQNSDARIKDYPFWIGEPEDIANIALFLASRESRMITGATIQADGGRSSY